MAIFGTAEGTSAALSDMQRVAQTQGQQLANRQGAMQLQEQQQMSQLMQQEAGKSDWSRMSPAEQMESMSRLSMGAGLVNQGAKLAGDAASIRLKQAQTDHVQAQQLNQQALAAKAELDTAGRLLEGVNDQASWDAANSLWESMSGRPSPFSGMEYNPVVVASMQKSLLSIKDRLDLAIKQQNADTNAKRVGSESSFREFRQGYMKDDMDLRRQRETRLGKVGGKASDMGTPGKSELDAADDKLRGAFPDLPQDEVNAASYSIASRARAIRKSTPGIDADEALDRALMEARAQGDFQTVNDTYKFFGKDTGVSRGKKTEFKRKGGSASAPTPVTVTADTPPEDFEAELKLRGFAQ